MSLLEWSEKGGADKNSLKENLDGLKNVPNEEKIIFLQDTLDVLFEILMKDSQDNESDSLVFDSLVSAQKKF